MTSTQTIYVKFSYENRVSEEIPIHTQLDLSKNSNRTRLLNRLLKSVPDGTEESCPEGTSETFFQYGWKSTSESTATVPKIELINMREPPRAALFELHPKPWTPTNRKGVQFCVENKL